MSLRLRLRALTALGLAVLAAVVAPAQASAQTAPPVELPATDGNNVELKTGQVTFTKDLVSIGPDRVHGLSLTAQWVDTGWRWLEVPTMSGNPNNPVVVYMGVSYAFNLVGSVYEPTRANGTSLSGLQLFTLPDGTQVTFASNQADVYKPAASNLAVPTQIVFPDGTKWTYTYNLHTVDDSYYDSFLDMWFYVYTNYVRVSSINNNLGYQIKFKYLEDNFVTVNWAEFSSASAINNAVEYCSPTANSCTLSGNWPTGSLDGSGITYMWGLTTYYTYTGGRIDHISSSAANDPLIEYEYTGGKVTGVTNRGGDWGYAYGTGTTTVTNPDLGTSVLAYSGNRVTSQTVGSLVTDYDYCTVNDSNCRVNLVKSVTAPNGTSTNYKYDTRGNVTEVRQLDRNGANPITTSATYAASCTYTSTCNKPNSITDAAGKITNYTYNNSTGQVTKVELPAAATGDQRATTNYSYSNYYAKAKNSSGTLVTLTDPVSLPVKTTACRTAATCAGTVNEQVAEIAYSNSSQANLLPVSTTSKLGNNTQVATTAYTYNEIGQVLSADGPLSGTSDATYHVYDSARRPVGMVGPDPDVGGSVPRPATKTIYTDGLVTSRETGTSTTTDLAGFTVNQSVDIDYDDYGREVRQIRRDSNDAIVAVVEQNYDTSGRSKCAAQRMNPSNWGTALANTCVPGTAGSAGPDRIIKTVYDAYGRALENRSAVGTALEQITRKTSWNTANGTSGSGQISWIEDARGNRTTYEYDAFGRQNKTRFPNPSTTHSSSTTDYELVGYNAVGNVSSFRTRRDETLTLTYDNLNRLTKKAVPSRSGLATTHTRDVYYGYDLLGNLTYARFDSASGEGITNAYDALGQLTSSTINMDSTSRPLAYQYDAAGNRTRITHPDNEYFAYSYYSSGALQNVKEGTNDLLRLGLDSAGRLAQIDRLDRTANQWGIPTTFGYNAASRLSSLAHNMVGSTSDVSTTFTYNPAGQIASSTRNNDLYAWDGHANVNRSYAANGLNQYSAVGGISLSYDTNGNVTSDGSNSYVYDVENRLVSGTVNGEAFTLRYDPLGRLYEADGDSGVTRFLYDGDDLVAEYNSSGAMLNRYVHGSTAGDDPMVWYVGSTVDYASRRYLYADERGSIVAVTDQNGAILVSNSYDEYGIPDLNSVTTKGRFRYTGQILIPDIGLYYYKARMYSPLLGRFMQTDPIGYGDGMNLYAYVGNDPVNNVDPTGLDCSPAQFEELKKQIDEASAILQCSRSIIVQGLRYWTDLDFQSLLKGISSKSEDGSLSQNNACRGAPISRAEAAAARAGDRKAFWSARAADGDPLAATALGIVNNSTFLGQEANLRLQTAIVDRSPRMNWLGVRNELDQIGVELMRAHVNAVNTFGNPSAAQIAAYHFQVFNAHGLPKSTFGGSPFTGSETEASITAHLPFAGWLGC